MYSHLREEIDVQTYPDVFMKIQFMSNCIQFQNSTIPFECEQNKL